MTLNLIQDDYGSFLGIEEGCIVIKDKYRRAEKYPLQKKEVKEVILRGSNSVSINALLTFASWNIDVLIVTEYGKPIAVLKNLDSESHVKTRIKQYEALSNDKGIYIAEQIIKSKIKGQNMVLNRYKFEPYEPEITIKYDNLKDIRKNFIGVEGKYARYYYNCIFKLFPEKIRPKNRRTYKAYEGLNNVFNLSYEILKYKVYNALIKAKLEPYLGYLHSMQFGKPSLLCDFQELYRYLIDDFLIRYCQKIRKKDFIVKSDIVSKNRKIKRVFLTHSQNNSLVESLNLLFYKKVQIPRIKIGQKQSIETLIKEEALLFAKYLRGERKTWIPRIPYL